MEFRVLVRVTAIALVLAVALVAYLVSSSYLSNANKPSIVGNYCVAQAPYVCSIPTMTTGGTMQFTFMQDSSKVIYNVELACLSTSNSLYGTPASAGVQYLPLADLTNAPTGLNVTTGQQIPIESLPCYGASGPLKQQPIGAQFTGEIYVNYTASPGPVGKPSNPWLSSRVATVSLRVS